jgi:hypothetical protein
LKDKNELSKTFSQWLTITKYHPSTIIRANTIFCSSQEEFEDTKGAIRNRISKNRRRYQRGNQKPYIEEQTKIPKGKSETVYRRTDNTMAKRKSTKGQTTIGKTYI